LASAAKLLEALKTAVMVWMPLGAVLSVGSRVANRL
jgi:hypothetical protein